MGKDTKENLAKDFVETVIKKVGLEAKVSVSEQPEAIKINIDGDNLGALIGYHGETLESLQLLSNLVVNNQEKGDWVRVIVDIGSYRAEKSESLVKLVERAAEDIRSGVQPRVSLSPMSASQRREVHLIVTENFADLKSESEGDEPYRRITLFKD